MTIQAIETRYAGCRFRSRTEARWAIALDEMRIRWEYEPQGYVIEDRDGRRSRYLPDFLLPDLGTWVEVKGTAEEIDRHRLEGAAISLPVLPALRRGPQVLLLGPIPERSAYASGWLGLEPHRDQVHDIGLFAVADRWVFTASLFDADGGRLVPTGIGDEVFEYALPGDLARPVPVDGRRTDWGVAVAFEAGRSARFEHGEAP